MATPRQKRTPVTALLTALALPAAALAHVPFLEEHDYTEKAPLEVHDVTNSKALNARLEPAGDVDFYRIRIDKPTRLVVSSNVPYCTQYRDFSVTVAVIGPGLPAPGVKLPVALSEGTGAVVIRDPVTDPDAREVYFEPITGRLSWVGPDYILNDAPPGTYHVIVWNEQGHAGDYTAVIGETDIFGPEDIAQARRLNPQMAQGKHLMVPCDPTAPDADERRKKAASRRGPDAVEVNSPEKER